MTSAMFPIHRPLIGAVTGLLLVSACSTAGGDAAVPPTPPTAEIAVDLAVGHAAEPTGAAPASRPSDVTGASSTSATPPAADEPIAGEPLSSTTVPVASTEPQSTVPPVRTGPFDVVDVAGGTIFGVGVFDAVDVDSVVGDVSSRLGSPSVDGGWQSMADQVNCAGSTDFRVVWWGDFRMTFERYQGDGVVRDELSAWTVGDPSLFPFAPIDGVHSMTSSEIVTLEGIGMGSTRADVEAAWANVNNGGDGRLVVVDHSGILLVRLDPGDQVVGFGDGPFDCPVDEMR